MLKLVSCVCLLASVVTGQYQGQYQPQPAYPGAPAQPAGLGQPITATNYNTGDGQVRSETVDNDGNVKGQYSYVDPSGKTITVKYTAGKDGFQVEGDHLPRAPAPVAPQPQYNPGQYQPTPAPQYNSYQPTPQPYYPQQAPQQLFSPASTYQQPAAPQQFSNFQQPSFPQQSSPFQHQPAGFPQQSNVYSQSPVSFPQQPAPQHRFGAGQVSVNQQPGQGYSYQFNLS